MSPRWVLLAVLPALMGVLAACGDDDTKKTSAAKKSRSPTAVPIKYDFGDAPPPHATGMADNGARHLDVTPGLAGEVRRRREEGQGAGGYSRLHRGQVR